MSATWKMRVWGATIAVVFSTAALATAGQWTDRTVLSFSHPVMIPGETLQPGEYVFDVSDISGVRHMVEVRQGDRLITRVQAVARKRTDPEGDVVVTFSPSETGTPPALKGWFAAGTVYGHELVYSEDEARKIASRSKSIVLSVDVPGTDLEQGKILVFNPAGTVAEWRADDVVMREWDAWQRGLPEDAEEAAEATATIVAPGAQGMRVELDDLDDDPQQYVGKTVSVDAEVEDVFGPRLFTIDQAPGEDRADMLVYMPTNMAALVREDDVVTVTGTVKSFVRADLEREWGWLGLAPHMELEFAKRPVLIASRIAGGGEDFAMVIDATAANKPVGTTGADAVVAVPIAVVTDIVNAGRDLVGRRVDLAALTVEGMAPGGGFYVRSGGRRLFVLPSVIDTATRPAVGDMVSIEGVVLRLPMAMRVRVAPDDDINADVYVYATRLDT